MWITSRNMTFFISSMVSGQLDLLQIFWQLRLIRPFNRSGANWAVALHILLYPECDQTSDLWQQLELASELKSDLIDTFDQDRKWLVDFNAGKTQLVLFHQLITLVLLTWKLMSPFLKKSHLSRCWGCLSLLN